jgi:hypothetical protein
LGSLPIFVDNAQLPIDGVAAWAFLFLASPSLQPKLTLTLSSQMAQAVQ